VTHSTGIILSENYPSTLPVCLSVCRLILSTQPTTLTCSAVVAGSDKQYLSDKITTLYIRTRSAADWLQTCTQLSGDSTTRFNTSVTPSHFSPLCFPRINVNTRVHMFLRLSTSCFLSYLTAVSHLQHFRFSQRCFWGFIASWMRVVVDKWAVTDVSNDRCNSFSRMKIERNRWINLEHKMEVSLFYLTTPTSNLPPILHQPHGRSADLATLIRWVSRQEVPTRVVT